MKIELGKSGRAAAQNSVLDPALPLNALRKQILHLLVGCFCPSMYSITQNDNNVNIHINFIKILKILTLKKKTFVFLSSSKTDQNVFAIIIL